MSEEGFQARQSSPSEVLRHLRVLLDRQSVVAGLVGKQDLSESRLDLVKTLTQRQQDAEVLQYLRRLHPADVAFALENMPPEERLRLWRVMPTVLRGTVLLELSDVIRGSVLQQESPADLIEALTPLPAQEVAFLVPDLPQDVAREVMSSLSSERRQEVRSVLSFPAGSVGALTSFEFLSASSDQTVGDVQAMIRERGGDLNEVPRVFVVSDQYQYLGSFRLLELLRHPPELRLDALCQDDVPVFRTHDRVRDAADAFERYDLVVAPVVNAHNQLVGCLPVEEVLDFLRESAQRDLLAQAGVREEDRYASIWQSSKRRFGWLAVNLATAFVASRVIGVFETTIEQLVALASLMPVVASIGGNTGNQTMALLIRGLSLNQVTLDNWHSFLAKEVMISLVNGALWGAVIGLFALLLYGVPGLAAVVTAAVLINLLIASVAGVIIPIVLQSLGQDPVLGSSVLLTGLTDCIGFLAILGLGAWLLTG